jgi:hypothetical protein
MNEARWHEHERAGSCANDIVVPDAEDELAFDDPERVHMLVMNVRPGAVLPATVTSLGHRELLPVVEDPEVTVRAPGDRLALPRGSHDGTHTTSLLALGNLTIFSGFPLAHGPEAGP